MSIIYFDICAIPLFVMILIICFSRRMTRGTANQLFVLLVLLSLLTTAADLGMEITSNRAPLSDRGVLFCSVCTYLYMILRSANNLMLLLFLLALTRTTFLIRKIWAKAVFSIPYIIALVLLAQNPFTHNVFTVTPAEGYARGPLMCAIYGIALVYGLGGLAYCIYCRRYLPQIKWSALLSIYVLVHIAVLIQLLRPDLLLEMFFTAVGEMMVMLSIMRPEERMDSNVGMLSWASYQSDLRNIILSGEHVQIVVIRIVNSREIRSYLGDQKYSRYLSELGNGIRAIRWKHQHRIELYYERPGTIYLVADEDETGTDRIVELLQSGADSALGHYEEIGVRFEPDVCLIRCPEDLRTAWDIISLGHNFREIENRDHSTIHASEVVHSRNFAVETHIEHILDRAIREDHIKIHYQPIYDVHSDSFHSAEALARIIDPEYGLISPAVFIPAAETLGFIIQLGDVVMEKVFRFVSEHDLDELGLSFIDINLSVAQCMESSLPEKILALQQKYGVDPKQVNFEITETTFDDISEIMVENINRLIGMGYRFALDDYGIGYSSIQRVNRIPLKIIKIDKSMLDETPTPNGRKILEHTMNMMKSIGKQLVVEGAETAGEVDMLKEMNSDFIQGFYYSRPLTEEDFVRFLGDRNGREKA